MSEETKLENPFVGLRAFEKSEEKYFFGRGAEINDLIKKFGKSRLLSVIGSSGSGKSSLVKSGLLPAVYGGFLSAGSNWHVALFRPGNDPIGNLAKELASAGVLEKKSKSKTNLTSTAPVKKKEDQELLEQIINSTLRRSVNGLAEAYRQSKLDPEKEKLLIVVDQFEELFRYNKYDKQLHGGKSDATHFINLLLNATIVNQSFPVYVIITMRSDFIGDCSEFRGLPEAINEGQYLVPRMTRDEMREAITGPITFAGAKITQRLVTRILNDIGNDLDQLPVLQHAMMRTWNYWDGENEKKFPGKKNTSDLPPIDFDDYKAIGEMSGALNQHADQIYNTLGDKQNTCELMFKALTDKAADVRGIRRPKSVEDLCILTGAKEKEIITLAEIFRKEGTTFLMPPPSKPLDKSSVIDISHESLMRLWQKLVKWTDDEVRHANIYKRLGSDAANEAIGEGKLWEDPVLALGKNWRDSFKSEEVLKTWSKSFDIDFVQAMSFLKRSEEEDTRQKKERARRVAAIRWIAAGLIVLFATLSGISYFQKVKADCLKVEADTSAARAFRAQILSDTNAAKAVRAQVLSDTNAAIATRAQILSDTNAAKAGRATIQAEKRRAEAIAEKRKAEVSDSLAQVSLRNVAIAEYQRLIREGPIDKDSINNANYFYKYVAYCNHLDTLRIKYNVANSVKKNEELYDKLYYSLKYGNNKKDASFVITDKVNENVAASEYDQQIFSLDGNDNVTAKNGIITIDNNGAQKTIQSDFKICSALKNDKDGLVFIGTEDNELNVYTSNLSGPVKIPMGGQITALSYDAENDIIFFGLKTGEIGYIKYASDKKNQPVYQNDLDFKITALEYFIDRHRRYLLATSSKGKAVVYELGTTQESLTNYLIENKKLAGIEWPENHGEIRTANYLNLKNEPRIELQTSTRIYTWNPFVDDLLQKARGRIDKKIMDPIMDDTNKYEPQKP